MSLLLPVQSEREDEQELTRQEINLARYPFALMAHRIPPGLRTWMQEWTIQQADGRARRARWTITGSDEYGLPTAYDYQFFRAVLKITADRDFPRQIEFSLYEVLNLMGKYPDPQNYERVVLALSRLSGVLIETENIFYDGDGREARKKLGFHIINSYQVEDSRWRNEDGLRQRDKTRIVWGDWFVAAENHYLKTTDWDLHRRLKRPLAQRLYEFVEANLYRQDQFRIGWRKLAFALSITAQFPSHVRKILEPHHAELKRQWHELGSVECELGNDGLVFVYCRRSLKPVQQVAAGGAHPLAQALRERGVHPKTIARLLRDYPTEQIKRNLDLVTQDLRDGKAIDRIGAYQTMAIEEDWASAQAAVKTETTAQDKVAANTAVTLLSRWQAEFYGEELPQDRQKELCAQVLTYFADRRRHLGPKNFSSARLLDDIRRITTAADYHLLIDRLTPAATAVP